MVKKKVKGRLVVGSVILGVVLLVAVSMFFLFQMTFFRDIAVAGITTESECNNFRSEDNIGKCSGDWVAFGCRWTGSSCRCSYASSDEPDWKRLCSLDESICDAGDFVCVSSGQYKQCNAEGTGFDVRSNCRSDEVCENGVGCVDKPKPVPVKICDSGERVCEGNVLRQCGGDGTFWVSTSCSSDKVCRGGACVDKPVDRICDEGKEECIDALSFRSCEGNKWVVEFCKPSEECKGSKCVLREKEEKEKKEKIVVPEGECVDFQDCKFGEGCDNGVCVTKIEQNTMVILGVVLVFIVGIIIFVTKKSKRRR